MEAGTVLVTLGALLLAGLAVEFAGGVLPLPRVTLLLLFGLAIGPGGLGLLSAETADDWFEPVTRVALVMVGFLVGERFSLPRLRRRGKVVFAMAATNVLGAAGLTALGLLALGVRPELAVLLAGIAGASAPAATFDVVAESRAEGPFTDTLLGIVGIDDAWGLLVFSLALAGMGALGAAYVLLRTAGLVLGAAAGAWWAGAERAVRRWTGLALLPQAGVALGMALVAEQRLPGPGATLLPLVIGSTVVVELLGPVCTRLALARAGERGRAQRT